MQPKPTTLIERLEKAMDYLDLTMPLTNGRDKTHPVPATDSPKTEKAA